LPEPIARQATSQRASVFRSGEPVSGEARLDTVDGPRDFLYTLSPVWGSDDHVEAVVATATDITDRKAADRRTAALLEIATQVSSARDLDEILSKVLPHTADFLGCRGVALFQVDPVTGHTRMLAEHGIPSELRPVATALSFPPARPFGGRLSRGESLVINDLTQQRWLSLDLCRQFGLQALVAAPLRVRDRALGAMVAFHTDINGRFDQDQVELFRGVARQLAVAVEADELQRAQQRGIAQLGSLAFESAQLVERLELANQSKSNFLATVSHELRTPIHIITGYHDMLLDGTLGPLNAEQTETLRRAAFSAVELSGLITAILDVSRLEAGRVEVDLTEIDLRRLIDEIDTEVQALVAEKESVRFAWEIDAAPATLKTDRTKLKIVLKNLICNGIKFTDSGEVVARIVERAEGVELSIRDTGSGIPAEKHKEIFEAFRQGDSSATRRHGGVGLGLHICKHFVELLGGKISVESTVGRGSCFLVRLPTVTGG
jgi:signal transduction histidine kinase